MELAGENILPKQGAQLPANTSKEQTEASSTDPEQRIRELQLRNDEILAEYKRLLQSKEKYLDLFQYSPVGYFVLSAEGRIIDANFSACKIAGTRREYLLSINFLKFISPEYYTEFCRHLHSVYVDAHSANESFPMRTCELKFVNENGLYFFVRLESTVILPTEETQTPFFRTAVIDITDQKNAELELQKAHIELERKIEERTADLFKEKSRLAEAQHLAQIGNWEWDIVENKIIWSDELCRIIGLNPQEVSPSRELLMEYVHPDDKSKALKSIEDAFNGDALHTHAYRIVRTDNTIRNIEAITEIIKDSRGNPVKMYGTARDITGKIEMAEKLKEVPLIKMLNSSAAASNMAETIEEAALTCIQNICEFSNWQTGHLYVVEKNGEKNMLVSTEIYYFDNSLNSKAKEFATFSDFKPGKILAEKVLEAKSSVWIDNLNIHEFSDSAANTQNFGLKSGFAFPVLLKHEVIGILEFFSTDYIRQDSRLMQIASYIGTHLGRVEERKRAREELKIAKEKAEISEKTKEQFLANISHEIRTPLNGILGFTNLLSDTVLTKEQRKYLKTVKNSTDNLLGIVNNVLDISKIETGKITFEETNFELKKLVTKATGSIKPKIKSKKLTLAIHFDKQVPRVIIGDPLRLNQVLLNLLSNAVKFTKRGGIEVKVNRTEEDADTVTLQFAVIDTGIGIRKNKLSDIFETFTQASSDITRKFGGTGLGLAIAKQLVELQNGKISVKSELNKGSEFSFILRFRKSAQAVLKRRNRPGPANAANQVSLKFAKILVVEDNLVNRQLVRKLLENYGMEVDTATNGKVALRKIAVNDYHLVLMDLQMPVMDGYEATRRIRSEFAHKDVPIIAVTAHALKGEADKCLEAGMNDYLSKPINPDDLFVKIHNYIFVGKNGQRAGGAIADEKEINLAFLNGLAKGNNGFIKEMSALFIRNTPQVLRKIETGFTLENFQDLKLFVHKLRSSVKIVGMDKCDKVLEELENDIAEDRINLAVFRNKIDEVKRRCARAIDELKKGVHATGRSEE
jgi:PAS domain S-box-containing protein